MEARPRPWPAEPQRFLVPPARRLSLPAAQISTAGLDRASGWGYRFLVKTAVTALALSGFNGLGPIFLINNCLRSVAYLKNGRDPRDADGEGWTPCFSGQPCQRPTAPDVDGPLPSPVSARQLPSTVPIGVLRRSRCFWHQTAKSTENRPVTMDPQNKRKTTMYDATHRANTLDTTQFSVLMFRRLLLTDWGWPSHSLRYPGRNLCSVQPWQLKAAQDLRTAVSRRSVGH